jgi:PAS domain S-box-containing protein
MRPFALLQKLRWGRTEVTTLPPADRGVMARSFAYLFGAGATLVLLSLPFTDGSDRVLAGLIGPPVAAYGVVALMLAGFDRLPLWLFKSLPGLGAVLVSIVVYSGGAEAFDAYAMMYFWVVLSAFYFFSWRQAAPNLFLVALAYAVVLTVHPGAVHTGFHWMMAVGTLVVSAVLLGLLRTRVERLIQKLSNDIIARKRAETKVREGEQRLRLVLETAQEAFISMDQEGLITAWNPEAEATFGWAASETVGRRLGDMIVPPAKRAAHERDLAHFLDTGESQMLGKRMEVDALHRDGHEFPVELTVTPLELGGRFHFNVFLRDISERRRDEAYLAAQHAVTRALAESSSIEEAVPKTLESLGTHMQWQRGGYWTFDRKARLLRCTCLWRSASVAAGEFDLNSLELRFQPGVGLPGRVRSSRRPVWIEDVTTDPNFPRAEVAGKEGLRAAIGLPVEVGGEVVAVIEFFAAEIKPPDEALMKMMTTISSQVSQFVERRMLEQEAERMKDEFFASVSHELRTPLTSILGYVDLLLAGHAGELTEQQHRVLEIADRNAKRQLRLVGELLFVSQVEAEKFVVEIGSVDLGSVAGEAVEAARPAAEAKGIGITLDVRSSDPLEGDEGRLAQLLDN